MNYDDLINKIDKLSTTTKKSLLSSFQNDNNIKIKEQENYQKCDNTINPIISIITPEWYHSDSFRLELNIQDTLEWDDLHQIDLMLVDMANKLNEIRTDNTFRPSIFEKSFCSWYQPYHYLPRTKWGIHIRYRSWLSITARLRNECPGLKSNQINSAKAAFLYLYTHELFHHLVENIASLIEIRSGHTFLYRMYLSQTYANSFNTHECLEESLANSYLVARANLCHIKEDYLEGQLLNQGPGYSDFISYLDTNFDKGLRKLILQIIDKRSNAHFDPQLNDLVLSVIRNQANNSSSNTNNNINSLCNIPVWIHYKPIPLHVGKL
jgi:hypothetical protein